MFEPGAQYFGLFVVGRKGERQYHRIPSLIGPRRRHAFDQTAKADVREQIVNTGVDLADALIKDPNLRVLVLNGYYDLATPFSATEYVMTHLGVPPEVGTHVQMKYYEAGHMMYVHPPSLAKMKRDLDAFIGSTARAR